jgi:nucleoside-diphosphate-sugar epimerase
MKIFATGITGTLGRKMPESVIPIKSRLEDFQHSQSEENFKDSTIIHMAGIVGVEKVKSNIQFSEKINVDCTMDLARISEKSGAAKFIYISSGHVYGNTNQSADESSPVNPQTLYAEQKCRAERKLIDFFGQTHTKLIILRIFSVVDISINSPSLGGQIKKIIGGDNTRPIKNGDDVRDFMKVETVSAIVNEIATSEVHSGIYNLCSGKSTTVRNLVKSILQDHGIRNYEHIESGNSDLPNNYGTNSKLVHALPNFKI